MRVVASFIIVSVIFLAGCRTTSEFNPFVSISSYETVVIEDFDGPGNSGYDFAERIARSLSKAGLFKDILRQDPEERAIRIEGVVTRYEKGNAALRLKFGPAMGQARFAAKVNLYDHQSGDLIGYLKISESFETSGPRAPIVQNLDTLAERGAERVARELIASGESEASQIDSLSSGNLFIDTSNSLRTFPSL